MSESIAAAELMQTLDKIQARIDGFRPLGKEEIIAIRKAASLDPEWVTQCVAALGASETVQHAVNATSEDLLAEIAEADAWTGVEIRLAVLLKGVAATNLARRHRIGLKALQIYGIGRQLIRQPEHHHLIPFVERLRQMNKLGKRKKKSEG